MATRLIQVGDVRLLYSPTGPRVVTPSAPPPPPAGLTPVWTVEYVDTAGVLQKTTINPDGSTSITVRQYAELTFDARDTRSIAANCDTAAGAAQRIVYGVNYGVVTGQVWSTSGWTKDLDIGPPIFEHCAEVAGTRTPILAMEDPDGRESSITFTLVVEALGAITDISAGGSWPTWVDFGVYGLTTGNYNSRGDIAMAGKVGIRIVKLGGGSDPIVAKFRPETRGHATPTNITDRSRDIVLVDIDYQQFATGTVGSSYCGSLRGHCRSFGSGYNEPLAFHYDAAARANDAISAGNCRHQRGTFIVEGGDVGAVSGEPDYCLIGGGRSWNLAGTRFVRTTGDNSANPMRTYMDSTVMRHVQVWSTTECFHVIKGSLRPNVYAATPTDGWPADDTFGDCALSHASWAAPGHGDGWEGNWGSGDNYFWVQRCVIGGPGAYTGATFICGLGPQNGDAPTNGETGPWANEDCFESADIGGYEDNVTTYNTGASLPLGGRNLSARGNTQLSGTAWGVAGTYNHARVHPSYRGTVLTSARPILSAFS